MMKKRLLSAVMASAMVLSLAACGGAKTETTAAETTAEKKEETTTAGTTTAETAEAVGGTLIVGFDQDFPGQWDLLATTANTQALTLISRKKSQAVSVSNTRHSRVAWDSKDMELESGNIDCIWNGFTITGREDDYTWTTPYMANKQVFVVANDSDIKSQTDLAGKVVEVQADSSAEAALKENQDLANTFGQLLTTPDYNTAFMDLEQGAVDAVAMDVIVAGYQIKQRNADFKILDDSLSEEEYGVGFKKGNTELRDKVQGALEEMAADGTLAKISDEWVRRGRYDDWKVSACRSCRNLAGYGNAV